MPKVKSYKPKIWTYRDALAASGRSFTLMADSAEGIRIPFDRKAAKNLADQISKDIGDGPEGGAGGAKLIAP